MTECPSHVTVSQASPLDPRAQLRDRVPPGSRLCVVRLSRRRRGMRCSDASDGDARLTATHGAETHTTLFGIVYNSLRQGLRRADDGVPITTVGRPCHSIHELNCETVFPPALDFALQRRVRVTGDARLTMRSTDIALFGIVYLPFNSDPYVRSTGTTHEPDR